MGLEIGPITKQQKIAMIILGIIGLYMLYTRVYAPMGSKIEDAAEKMKKKSTRLAKMRREAARLNVLEKEIELLEKHLDVTEKMLPKKKEIPQFITLITDTAAKYGIEVKTISVKSSEKASYYNMQPYGMNLTADYHTLGMLFTDIANLKRIFNIENVSMSPEGENITASFSLITYTFKQ